MNRNNVILLYEGDAWLSRHSLYLRGIFTTEDDFRRYTQDMAEKGVIDKDGLEQLQTGNGQTSGIGDWSNMMFMKKVADVNPTEYDG